MPTASNSLDLIGVGSPIMDLLAPVPDAFLAQVAGAKGGMVLVDPPEMQRILSLLDRAPACTTGGSAANATLNATRLGLRTTFLGKLGNDGLADTYRRRFEAAASRREAEVNGAFKRSRVEALSLSTEDDLVRAIVRMATIRRRRRM